MVNDRVQEMMLNHTDTYITCVWIGIWYAYELETYVNGMRKYIFSIMKSWQERE
jgi:hypothetical protein